MRNLTPVKAIRAKCLDCSAWQPSEVRNCIIPDCPIYPYRLGKNPNRSGMTRRTGLPCEKQASRVDVCGQDIVEQGIGKG